MSGKRSSEAAEASVTGGGSGRRRQSRVVYVDPDSDEDEDFLQETAAAATTPRRANKGKRRVSESDEESFEEVPRQQAAKGKRKKGRKELAVVSQDVHVVLQKVHSLRDRMKTDAGVQQTVQELGLANVREVTEMTNDQVRVQIEDLILSVMESIMKGDAFRYDVPTRSASNQEYVAALDRNVLGDKMSVRQFLNTNHVRKTAITTKVVELLHEILSKGIHITKRDLFYTDVKLFRQQNDSDTILDDVACMVGCTRNSLNVIASDKGLVVGRVSFTEAGDPIDCRRMGIGGKAIPPYTDKITNIQSDADFILLVEKEAAYMRLAEDRFYLRYPCIIVTAKGQPDVATRLFLRKLRDTLRIPVFGLVDSDPYGLKILSVYMSGSKNMSYDSGSLTTSDIHWLGVRPSDLDRYNMPEQCRLDMTEKDIKTGKELLQEEFIRKNPKWTEELELMLSTKKKAEIQALSAFGFQYITQEYLPRKLQEADWI